MANRSKQDKSAWLDRLEEQRREEGLEPEAAKTAASVSHKSIPRPSSASRKSRAGTNGNPQPAATQRGRTGNTPASKAQTAPRPTPVRRVRQHRRATGPRYEEHLRPLMLRNRNVSVYFHPEDRRWLERIAKESHMAPSRWIVSFLDRNVADWERAADLEPLTVADLDKPPPVWSGAREKAAGRTDRVGLAMTEMLYRRLIRLAFRSERSLSSYIRAAVVMNLTALGSVPK